MIKKKPNKRKVPISEEFYFSTGITVAEFSIKTGIPKTTVHRHLSSGSCSLTSKCTVKHTHTHPLYRTWYTIKTRCYNENRQGFKDYGGRGIRMCGRWFYSFDNFVEDMGERPEGYSIDRIDNDGDYSPDNCRWADSFTQARNTSKGRGHIHATRNNTYRVYFCSTSIGTLKTLSEAEGLIKDLKYAQDQGEW